MTKTSKATQIKAIEKIELLRKNGVTMANARSVVANEFNTKVYTLTQWQKKHGPTVVTNGGNNVVASRKNTSKRGFNGLYNTLFSTIEDLREGISSPEEARAISTIANSLTNMKKFEFSIHKHVSRATNQNISIDKLLNQ
jgi:uncharacterized protein YoaH (UPF0181 family)